MNLSVYNIRLFIAFKSHIFSLSARYTGCMCHFGLQQNTLTCQSKQLQHGLTEGRSTSSSFLVDIEGLNSVEKEIPAQEPPPTATKKRKSTSATAGSLPTAKKTTCNDRSITCRRNTQDGPSTPTSGRVSTGNGKVLKPFYDDACREISARLRWHTRTDSPDSDSNSSNMSWHSVASNCCVKVNLLTNREKQSSSTTFSALSQCSARASTADGTTTRVRKIVLHPTKEVAQKLTRWMGCCRWTYNQALAYINDGKEHKKTFYWLRNRFVNASNVKPSSKFLLETPKHVREGAVKDLALAFSNNFKRKKKDPGHTFSIRFRKKKDAQSIVIPKSAFVQKGNGVVMYPQMLTKEPLVHIMPKHDCRLSIDRTGRFVLYVPIDVPVKKFTPAHNNHVERVVALDPGVRTFLTSWSPDGTAYKLGDGNSTKIYQLMLRIDSLMARCSKATGRSKWRKKKKLESFRRRLENLQRDLHYQCASFLTSKYDEIIIPVFGSKRMSSKLDRRLKTKTVRAMLGLGHYAFRQVLKDVAARKGVVVSECTEEYTSKTCSCCGWLHPSLGGSKTFSCRACSNTVDRDLQGAFNIFLKHTKEQHPGFAWVAGPQTLRP